MSHVPSSKHEHARWEWEGELPEKAMNHGLKIAYVQGYILALEDVIDDAIGDKLNEEKIRESLASARRTLEVLADGL